MARRKGPPEEHESAERWLLTYSDMITLLMALFIVLFSISSVNISKYITLQQSLRAAFSGSILSGGASILPGGQQATTKNYNSNTAVPTIVPLQPTIPKPIDQGASAGETASLLKAAQAASQETSDFVALQHRLNAYAKAHGFSNQVYAQIVERGLVVTILTDKLLFASGSDQLKPGADPLLNEISTLINIDPEKHPVDVEGYTDNVPIHTAQFPSNWELSSGRADTVLEYLLGHGVNGNRLGADGYADYHPIALNTTAAGRAKNRRVEIVFVRKFQTPSPGA